MKAIVLAGGMGTRLHPLTVNLPKPMVPVANRPIMAYLIELLAKHGFDEITALLYHQPEIIKDYFKDGSSFKVKMSYIEAPHDFGTAGAVRFAVQSAKEPILIISADLITDINLSEIMRFHKKKKAAVTIALTRVKNPLSYGIVILDKKAKVKKFLEKPSWGEVFSDTINAGIYVLDPAVLDFIPPEKSFDFSHDLFPLLLTKRRPIFGFITAGYWKDIGKIEDYGRAQDEVLSEKIKLSLPGKKMKEKNFWLGERVIIASSARLEGKGAIDNDSIVADQAVVLNTVIGKNCKIGRGAYLRETILLDGVEIGSEVKLERAVVSKNVKIDDRTTLDEGVVVGEESRIGKDVNIKPFIKIWPRKIIEEGSTVSRTIIWRERWTKSIFGPYGVTGVCNLEISPEFAVTLGAAFGSMLGKGERISCSRDSHKASRMIYRALVSGVLSTGVNISNLEMMPIPVNRYEIRSLKSKGGFHVRRSPFDPQLLDIKFFDAHGMDLSSTSEKKIERLFFAEDFVRATCEEAGELSYPIHRVAEEYKFSLLNYLSAEAICRSNLKVVIDYAHSSAAQIFPSILGELGMEVIALNAYIDETKITKDKATFERSVEHFKKIVKSLDADLGIMLDTGAEKIILCDENGNILDGDQTLGLMSLLFMRSKKKATLAVPVKESRLIEQLAHKYHAKVLRTKNSFRGMMEVAAAGDADFVGEGLGGYIFPNFIPSFDAMLSACKLVEFLCQEGTKLSEITAELPAINLIKTEIPCPSEQKGELIRKLADSTKDADKMETIDGLKFWHGGDWVLILPDSLHPKIHLYAEADTKREANLLLDKYTAKIRGELEKN